MAVVETLIRQHAPQDTHVTKTTTASEERLINVSNIFFLSEIFPTRTGEPEIKSAQRNCSGYSFTI